MNNPKGVPTNWDEVDDVLGEMRKVVALRDKAVAKRDLEIAKIAESHAGDINTLENEIAGLRVKVTDFMQAHKAEFGEPGTRGRFRDLLHGRVGFRQAAPKLDVLRSMTFDDIVEYMLAHADRLGRFIRTTHEPNRQAILADMDVDTMVEVGLQIVQDDRPFIDPKAG